MIKTILLGVILLFINVAIVTAQDYTAKQDPISKITEVTPTSPVHNTFAYMPAIYNDASVPAVYRKKGSATIGVIYISLLSKQPMIYNGEAPPKFVNLYLDDQVLSVRLVFDKKRKTFLGYEETFLLIFHEKAMKQMLESRQAYFMMHEKAFIIDPLIRKNLVLIKEAGFLVE